MWCVLQLLAGSLFPRKEGRFPTGYDLGQGRAASPGPRLRCVESTDLGELGVALGAQELGTREGERRGSRGSVCVRSGTYTCPLRVRTARAQWRSLV